MFCLQPPESHFWSQPSSIAQRPRAHSESFYSMLAIAEISPREGFLPDWRPCAHGRRRKRGNPRPQRGPPDELHGLSLEVGEIETAMRRWPSLGTARHVSFARVAAFVQLSEDDAIPPLSPFSANHHPTTRSCLTLRNRPCARSCQ